MNIREEKDTKIEILERHDNLNDILKFLRDYISNINNEMKTVIYENELYLGIIVSPKISYLSSKPKCRLCSIGLAVETINQIINKNMKIEKYLDMRQDIKELTQEVRKSNMFQLQDYVEYFDQQFHQLKTKINSINQKKEIDYTQEMKEFEKHLQNLENQWKQLNYNIENQKSILRDVRNQGESQSDTIETIARTINTIPGTMNLLTDQLSHFQESQISPVQEENDLYIDQPDIKMLKEMFETSQKLNEMILQTAIALANQDNGGDHHD